MNILPIERLASEVAETVGITDLALACAMSMDDLRELIDFGALFPLDSASAEPVFAISCIEPLRRAEKQRQDYDLDLFVVVIAMDYIRRIDQLESQVRTLMARSQCHH